MNDKSERYRQRGKIRSATMDNERCETVNLMIEFAGSCQGFGGLALGGEHTRRYIDDLCRTFGVSNLDRLVGLECFALRCFSAWNEHIEGLESIDGKRFVHSDWRRKYFPDRAPTPLDDRRKSLLSRADSLANQLKDNARQLAEIDADYVSWESA